MNLPSHLARDRPCSLAVVRRDDELVEDFETSEKESYQFLYEFYRQSLVSGDQRYRKNKDGIRQTDRPSESTRIWITVCSIALMEVVTIYLYFFHRSDTNSTRNLRRRQLTDSCATNDTETSSYDLPLHIGALFIILIVSGSACAFPLLATRFPKLRIPSLSLYVIQHFGTGVLLATAFVHLLPTAFISLLDPCLGAFWTDMFPAMPGAIALAAVLGVTVVEMAFSPGRHCCGGLERNLEGSAAVSGGADRRETEGEVGQEFVRRHVVVGRGTSMGRELSRTGRDIEQVDSSELTTKEKPVLETTENLPVDGTLTPAQQKQKALVQCTLLEAGILFHSIFIGMALSVAHGPDFIVLLIAIIFHQTCEGLALGARIARIPFDPSAKQPWMMVLAYGCTTPLGQALGLATRGLYDPASATGWMVVGICNAVSAGLLVFNSLVELLSEDFLSDESWRVLRGGRRWGAFGLVVLGAFGMGLIGAWA